MTDLERKEISTLAAMELVKEMCSRITQDETEVYFYKDLKELLEAIEYLKECRNEYVKEKSNEKAPVKVTVTRWISVTDRLPEKTGAYLVNHSGEKYSISNYSTLHKMFGTYDSIDSTECADTDVTHWMKLPEPPTE